jgi:glutathione peroxidase
MINSLIFIYGLFATSFYSISTSTIDGNNLSMGQFQGKKILIVNTASTSKFTSQYGTLEQLYEKYSDKLIVLACPTNDFNNDTSSASVIKDFVMNNYKVTYVLCSKQIVKGANMSPMYYWLSSSSQNGVMDSPVIEDFCKYLIDENGNIIGVFAGSVDPMSDVIQNAISN